MENSCHYSAFVDDYVHDEISDRDRSEFERHLRSCRLCAEEVRTLGSMRQSLTDSFSVTLDARFDYAVVSSLRKEHQAGQTKELRLALEDIIISLATLLVIVLIGIQLFNKPKVSSVEMVGKLDNIERSSLEQTKLSNDQVLELVLRNK